jgi:hypothetical protein
VAFEIGLALHLAQLLGFFLHLLYASPHC